MNALRLPKTPVGWSLEKAFLSTFDLDENLLAGLIGDEDVHKFLIVRGDGEYVPLKEESPIKGRIVDVFFEKTKKKLPNGKFQPVRYHHAKIWLFLYRNEAGIRTGKLIFQSQNIFTYDSIEIALSFSGTKVEERQAKNAPLVTYFETLLPFLHDEKLEFVKSLIEELPFLAFESDGEYEADDFEFITPCCENIPLLREEFDEALVVAPFINVETMNELLANKRGDGPCVVLSQAKINESLILNDVKGVQFLSPRITKKFVHSKLYLVRKGDAWDMYAGSMNLSDYSVAKNVEAMAHLKNVKSIEGIAPFLARFIGHDVTGELNQHSRDYEDAKASPVFNNAYKIETRIQYIKRLIVNKKYDEETMGGVSSYLLSIRSVHDLSDIAAFKKELIPTRREVITGKNKHRFVYNLSFKENLLLGLVNYSLHQYDDLFSKSVFLHVLDRSLDNAFIKIHETKGLKDFYFFRTDIHDFDPSIDKAILCEQLDALCGFDKRFCDFAKTIVNESRYRLKGDENIHQDDIIHQTGLPLGGFFENVYLHDVDFLLEKAPLYLRCGDDILIGSPDKDEIERLFALLVKMLEDKKLSVSETKTTLTSPGENVLYLGWKISNGNVDFTDETLQNIHKTIKNRTKSLLIMYGKMKMPSALCLPSLLRYVKHYQKSEFFIHSFKRITTTDGLKQIDRMILDLIRSVASGKTGNAKYKVKYETIQAFGYKSLVNQYYEYISSRE